MNALIAGIPKSGTTALLFKIAKSIAGPNLTLLEPTDGKAVYQRPDLQQVDLNTVTILAKILCTPRISSDQNLCQLPNVDFASFQRYHKKVFLMRDPRDNLISFMLYMVVNTKRLIEPKAARGLVERIQRKESAPDHVSIMEILNYMSSANRSNLLETFLQWQDFGDVDTRPIGNLPPNQNCQRKRAASTSVASPMNIMRCKSKRTASDRIGKTHPDLLAWDHNGPCCQPNTMLP